MKFILRLHIVLFLLSQLSFSQIIEPIDNNSSSVAISKTKLNKIVFELELNSINDNLKKHHPFLISDINPTYFNHNLKNLNKKLFSNFEIVENTYMDYTDYLKGCGPLDDGITNKVDSRDLMFSTFLDNLVKKWIFKGKGVFFKK